MEPRAFGRVALLAVALLIASVPALPAAAFFITDPDWRVNVFGDYIVRPGAYAYYTVNGTFYGSGRAWLRVYVDVRTPRGWVEIYSIDILPDATYHGPVSFERRFGVLIPSDAEPETPVYIRLEAYPRRAWAAMVSIVAHEGFTSEIIEGLTGRLHTMTIVACALAGATAALGAALAVLAVRRAKRG